MGVLNAAFDINENRGKEGGQARVDGSQYKTKERVTRIGSADARATKSFFWRLPEKLAQLS